MSTLEFLIAAQRARLYARRGYSAERLAYITGLPLIECRIIKGCHD